MMNEDRILIEFLYFLIGLKGASLGLNEDRGLVVSA